jgi:2-methylcitrate dehydratase PrpD
VTALQQEDVAAIGRFAAGTRLDDVPDDVVAFARLLLVDTLGALLGGLRYPPVREAPSIRRATGCRPSRPRTRPRTRSRSSCTPRRRPG